MMALPCIASKVCQPYLVRALQRRFPRLRHEPYARYIHMLECNWTFRAGLKRRHRERPFDWVQFTHLQGSGVFSDTLADSSEALELP